MRGKCNYLAINDDFILASINEGRTSLSEASGIMRVVHAEHVAELKGGDAILTDMKFVI